MTSRNYDRFAANRILAADGTVSPKEATVRAICTDTGAEFVGFRRAHSPSGAKLKSHDLFIRRDRDLHDIKALKAAIRERASAAGIDLRTIEAH